MTLMGRGRTGQTGLSAPNLVVAALKHERDPVPIPLLKEMARVVQARWRKLQLVLRILVLNVSVSKKS